jgi:FkbM family methyltransferase
MIERSLAALVLTKIRVPFPIPSTRFGTIEFIRFMQMYGSGLNYEGPGKLTIRDLDFTINVNASALYYKACRTYFEVKDRMHIYRIGNQIFSEVDSVKFIVPFPHGLLELKETFIEQLYKSGRIKNKIVLDIGAFIGDTSVYFVRQNASHVFAFEAALPLFKIAAENIELNNLSDKVTLRNEALTETSKLVSFVYDENWLGGSRVASFISGKKGTKTFQVQGITLKQIIKETGDVGLLKMDIEGAEHQIILNAVKNNLLDPIESIIMEVHGSNVNLIRALQACGYRVDLLKTLDAERSLVSASKT